jgi:hypothetical protein
LTHSELDELPTKREDYQIDKVKTMKKLATVRALRNPDLLVEAGESH